MNGLDFLSEKIGRKQLIAIVGMIVLAQVGAESWQVMAVAFAGISSQLVIDWFRPREKVNNKLFSYMKGMNNEENAAV